MGIVDEIISHSQGQTSYKVRVKSFIQKMDTWKNGKVIRLKSFSVDGVKLRMKVYPNGIDEECRGNVSMMIENLNDFKIRLNCDFSIGYKTVLTDVTYNLSPNTYTGVKQFYNHRRNHSGAETTCSDHSECPPFPKSPPLIMMRTLK